MTMTLVSSIEVGAGGAASIEFTGIPQTGTDLYLVVSVRGATGTPSTLIQFNSSTTGYSARILEGSGSAASSFTATDGYIGEGGYSTFTANTFSSNAVYIPNYAGSTNKSWSADGVNENNATQAFQDIIAGLWSNTAAITSLTVKPRSAVNFAQYSTASLYIVTKGSGGASVS